MDSDYPACNICGCGMHHQFKSRILGKYDANYVRCSKCDLLQVVAPTWLDEAYSSPISALDTGLVKRNLIIAQRVSGLLGAWFGAQAGCVDLAGGCGLLVRLLRDRGLDALWDDPYAGNELARGFEYHSGFTVAAATAIEVLEHTERPLDFIRDSFAKTGAQAVIFTTELYKGATPPPDWWYYQPQTGQHITFMTLRTLQHIASALGAHLYSRGTFHALTLTPMSSVAFALAATRMRSALDVWANRHRVSRTQSDSVLLARPTSS